MDEHDKWIEQVDQVFKTAPRIGTGDSFWLDRKDGSMNLNHAFQSAGALVCLDGPSGAGKTSLAFTHLVQKRIVHATVQFTTSMNWQSFCRELLTKSTNREESLSGELEIGIEQALPTIKATFSFGEKHNNLSDATLIDLLSKSWTEHDVARALYSLNCAICLDDMEKASDDLIRRLSDLCKLFTQSFFRKDVRVLLVGSGNIYQRLIKYNTGLEDRLKEVSLGGFKTQNGSWNFLTRGFEKLNLNHPENSFSPREHSQISSTRNAVWKAADGLPKSINLLGHDIAVSSFGRSYVPAQKIKEKANNMAQDHWIQYSQKYSELIDCLASTPLAIRVLKSLYLENIGSIHNLSKVITSIKKKQPQDMMQIDANDILTAVDQLVKVGFLCRTGQSNEVIFVQNPASAHALGVYMRNPNQFPNIINVERINDNIRAAFPKLRNSDFSEPE